MKKIIKLEPNDHVVIESDKIIITKENTATENSDVVYRKPIESFYDINALIKPILKLCVEKGWNVHEAKLAMKKAEEYLDEISQTALITENDY